MAIFTVWRDSTFHEVKEIRMHLIFLACFATVVLFVPFRLRNWDD